MRILNIQKLKDKIEGQCLTPESFAKRNGITPQTLHLWIRGKRNAKIDNIRKLADALNCDLDAISDIVLQSNPHQMAAYDRRRQELDAMFAYLTKEQQESIISIVTAMANINKDKYQSEHT